MLNHLPETIWVKVVTEKYPKLKILNVDDFRKADLGYDDIWFWGRYNSDIEYTDANLRWLKNWGVKTLAIKQKGQVTFYNLQKLIDNPQLVAKICGVVKLTSTTFEAKTGYKPQQDDLERVNCETVGVTGHYSCGWCYRHDQPRFQCGCVGKHKAIFF